MNTYVLTIASRSVVSANSSQFPNNRGGRCAFTHLNEASEPLPRQLKSENQEQKS